MTVGRGLLSCLIYHTLHDCTAREVVGSASVVSFNTLDTLVHVIVCIFLKIQWIAMKRFGVEEQIRGSALGFMLYAISFCRQASTHIQWWSWCVMIFFVRAQDPVAVLPQGRLLGNKVFPESSSKPIEIFYGIPYANPPIGRYRFSAPERHPGWRHTLLAHRPPPQCPDVAHHVDERSNEDCLYVNIWTPQHAEGSRMPVLVVLFSESWSRAGPQLAAQELAAAGLVVVSVAYRLHILGWFTLRSAAARGNLGLLDQYLALLWVRDNIAAFGGDPSAVTLLGHSAGADSVLYHVTSARTEGLFQKAIVMSPRDIWRAVSDDSNSNDGTLNTTATERISREIAAALGCASDDNHAIVKCMQARPLAQIVQLYNNSDWITDLRPVADDFLPESAQYVPRRLAYALAMSSPTVKRPINLLFGTTNLESISQNEMNFENLVNRGAENLMEHATLNVIPELLKCHGLYESSTKYTRPFDGNIGECRMRTREVGRLRRRLKGRCRALFGGAGGALIAARLARMARLHVYRYTQAGGIDLHGRELNYTGAAHGTDFVALLGEAMLQQLSRRRATPVEQRLSGRLRAYITNFIKYGSPEVDGEWPPYRAGAAYIHEIQEPAATIGQANNRDAAFWLQHLPRHANSTAPTTFLEHPERFTGKVSGATDRNHISPFDAVLIRRVRVRFKTVFRTDFIFFNIFQTTSFLSTTSGGHRMCSFIFYIERLSYLSLVPALYSDPSTVLDFELTHVLGSNPGPALGWNSGPFINIIFGLGPGSQFCSPSHFTLLFI
ncbi:Pyrethroid hydrolase Ces2a [Eumeta japonica]|uniref:Pyrethroid hydrolase Ces2a n=1 Tax=Eumeta variegata TaxID=151549 RepID=A0A4C1W6E8_EUMVA|nr:Pyrethroid hydrolase Ces2a [Eumeta japonica]